MIAGLATSYVVGIVGCIVYEAINGSTMTPLRPRRGSARDFDERSTLFPYEWNIAAQIQHDMRNGGRLHVARPAPLGSVGAIVAADVSGIRVGLLPTPSCGFVSLLTLRSAWSMSGTSHSCSKANLTTPVRQDLQLRTRLSRISSDAMPVADLADTVLAKPAATDGTAVFFAAS
ncbi:hypothetical protein [Paracoccus mutanolyticus]|uniref:hypothetical protein n=1 Tax=Paracoccus mutanolyticus TaxID=1499308 RepID=UPI0011AE8AE0|nr:hypothetical protein [Paracoccus mutanolyticus]